MSYLLRLLFLFSFILTPLIAKADCSTGDDYTKAKAHLENEFANDFATQNAVLNEILHHMDIHNAMEWLTYLRDHLAATPPIRKEMESTMVDEAYWVASDLAPAVKAVNKSIRKLMCPKGTGRVSNDKKVFEIALERWNNLDANWRMNGSTINYSSTTAKIDSDLVGCVKSGYGWSATDNIAPTYSRWADLTVDFNPGANHYVMYVSVCTQKALGMTRVRSCSTYDLLKNESLTHNIEESFRGPMILASDGWGLPHMPKGTLQTGPGSGWVSLIEGVPMDKFNNMPLYQQNDFLTDVVTLSPEAFIKKRAASGCYKS